MRSPRPLPRSRPLLPRHILQRCFTRLATLLSPLALTACPDDPAADPQMEIIALDPNYVSHPVADGDTVSILFPPQGGRVIFAGARVTNVSPCVQLSGALRDPVTNQVRFESRTVLLEPQPDGWAISIDADISTFSNIPVCPNQWSSQDVFDQDYQLTLQITDHEDRSVARTLMVRPACNEPGPGLTEECLCICKQGYQLGEACPTPDAP